MTRNLFLILILFNSLTTMAQEQFDIIQTQKFKKDTTINKFHGIVSYRFDKYQILVGIERNEKASEIRLLLLENDKVIAKTCNPTCTCTTYDIYFFKKDNQYILLGEQGEDGIWGYDIYFLDNTLRFLGILKYTGIQKFGDTNGPRSSIIPCIKRIKKDALKIVIEFKDQEMYQILNNGRDKVIRGKENTFSIDL